MEGRLSNMQNCAAILQYLGKSKDGFPSYLPTNKKPMEGHLAACRSAKHFCNTKKNPRRDFFWSYAAMEPRQYRPKGGMSVSEGRNGGGAKALTVELAKAQDGRAIRTNVLKSTVQKKKNAKRGPESKSLVEAPNG